MTTYQPLPQYAPISYPTLESVKSSILTSIDEYIAVDTETTGLKWIEDRAFGVAIAWDDKAVFLRNTDFGAENIGVMLTDVFAAPNKTFVFHNAEFDLHMIRETYGTLPPKNILDTLRLSHLRDSSSSHGLKDLASMEFGPSATASEDTIKTYMTQYRLKNYSYVPSEFMDPYACYDVVFTKALAYLYIDEIRENYPSLLMLEHKLIPVILDMEQRGIKVDLEYAVLLHRQLKAEQRDILDEVYGIVGRPIEIGSTKQLQGYFYDQLRIPPPRETKSGGRSTDEKALDVIKNQNIEGSKVSELVLRWRAIDKADSTYVQAYQKLANNGRIHSHFNACGPITGRLSSSSPNLQQVPADPKIRRLFVPDQEFFDFDYSQIEMRVAAHASQEQSMIKILNDGTDLHHYTASLVYGQSPTKDQRQIGKKLNFGSLYGGGSKKLALEAGITEDQSRYLLNKFWSAYPLLRQFITKQKYRAEQRGYVKTLYGRKVPVNPDDSYKAINYIIQGTAGDMLKISLYNTWCYLDSIGGRIRNTVHDSITVDEIEETEVPKIKSVMEDFNDSSNGKFCVPILVDMKRSKNSWGDMLDE